VWVAPEVAAVAPLVDGWPRLLGCAWCHIKERHLIPRPPVICGDCEHFVRDKINPSCGMGRCGARCDPDRPWPEAKQDCGRFEPSGNQQRLMITTPTDQAVGAENNGDKENGIGRT
jgi:hypothetical protein